MQDPTRLLRTLALLTAAAALAACGSSGSPGGSAPAQPPVTSVPGDDPLAPRTRYSFNNGCFALFSNATSGYVQVAGGGYDANATDVASAEAFFMKPAALGSYLFYNRSRQLLTAGAPAGNSALDAASASAGSHVGVITSRR